MTDIEIVIQSIPKSGLYEAIIHINKVQEEDEKNFEVFKESYLC